MEPKDFCYWLQGWLEIQDPKEITGGELQEIKNHLRLVFNKVTPEIKKQATPKELTQTWKDVKRPFITEKDWHIPSTGDWEITC